MAKKPSLAKWSAVCAGPCSQVQQFEGCFYQKPGLPLVSSHPEEEHLEKRFKLLYYDTINIDLKVTPW
ncbi:AT-rich interactive domain-containing protein 5A [Frankliniella fusca]|uniref:AT-rich interactive domain-containing protein 5A n=1 Tax=Frankliniella fusca TaxID=407009 RepID=A0AAE1GZ19_9NEOP|nr:AT-rich interactive domain-containing protein 5A [Frankliniella fusca]